MNRFKMNKYKNMFLIIIVFTLFLGEIVLVNNSYFINIDNNVYNIIKTIINDRNTIIFKAFSFLGTEIFVIILCIILIVIKKGRGVAFTAIMFVSTLLTQAIKIIIARPRPNINPLAIENSYSFPSGHTVTIVVLVGILLFWLWQEKGSKKNKEDKNKKLCKKIILTIILIFIAFNVMLSRIYLGVHYFSDILAGIIFGIFYLLSTHYYIYNYEKVPLPFKIKK